MQTPPTSPRRHQPPAAPSRRSSQQRLEETIGEIINISSSPHGAVRCLLFALKQRHQVTPPTVTPVDAQRISKALKGSVRRFFDDVYTFRAPVWTYLYRALQQELMDAQRRLEFQLDNHADQTGPVWQAVRHYYEQEEEGVLYMSLDVRRGHHQLCIGIFNEEGDNNVVEHHLDFME